MTSLASVAQGARSLSLAQSDLVLVGTTSAGILWGHIQMCGSGNQQRCVVDARLTHDYPALQMPEATTQLITDSLRTQLLAVGVKQITQFTNLPEPFELDGGTRYTTPQVPSSEIGTLPSGETIAAVFHVAIAPDGQTIVATRSTESDSGELSASVDVIELLTGNTVARSPFSARNINAICLYSSNASRIVTSDMSLTSGLILWDGQVAGAVSVISDSNMASDPISGISFSLDGTRVQTSHNSTSSRIWNQQTLAEVASADSTLFLPADVTTAARYRSTSLAVLEGSGIAIRSISSNQLIHTVKIPTSTRIIAISWHPAGHRIAFTDGFRLFASTVIKGGRVILQSVIMNGCTASLMDQPSFEQLGHAEGGAICVAGVSSLAVLNAVTIVNCTAYSSRSNAYGGALFLNGGLLSMTYSRVAECSITAPLGAAYGGAILVFEGTLELESSVFEHNGVINSRTLVRGTALYYLSSSQSSFVSLCQFWSNFGPFRSFESDTVKAVSPITWVCKLGQYSPRVGDFYGSFSGCSLECAAGYYGQDTHLETSDCSGACPANHYCPAGTVYPLSCPAGTSISSSNLGLSLASCLTPRKASLAQVVADGVAVKLHKTMRGSTASTSVNVTLTIEGTSLAPAIWMIEEPTVPWLPLKTRVGHIGESAESQSELMFRPSALRETHDFPHTWFFY